MTFKRMEELVLTGKRVLIREDLNVPIAAGEVASDARIAAALPTLTQALGQGARVVVMSHLGRPQEGKFDPAFSLLPVARRLSELLAEEVPLFARSRCRPNIERAQSPCWRTCVSCPARRPMTLGWLPGWRHWPTSS